MLICNPNTLWYGRCTYQYECTYNASVYRLKIRIDWNGVIEKRRNDLLHSISITNGIPTVAFPTALFMVLSMIKDGYEDYARPLLDKKENNKCTMHKKMRGSSPFENYKGCADFITMNPDTECIGGKGYYFYDSVRG